MSCILKIEDLRTYFYVKKGVSKVVNGLNLEVEKGHLVGIVGESGSGKSVAAHAFMGSVRKPGKIESGKVLFKNEVDILSLELEERRKYWGSAMAIIAANARGHLNPMAKVGSQISDAYLAQNKATKKEAWEKAVDLLKAVGLTDPESRAKAYPHELSGGMAQRCMIALALVNNPEFLIADDATNGLDVTVQAQIMELITKMLDERGMSGLFITHDLGVVSQCCNEIAIMYSGQIIEKAPVKEFFSNTLHPYSISLVNSVPEKRDLSNKVSMWDFVPDPLNLPKGCLFHPRCKYACEKCRTQEPKDLHIGNGHFIKCHNFVSSEISKKEGAK